MYIMINSILNSFIFFREREINYIKRKEKLNSIPSTAGIERKNRIHNNIILCTHV